MVSASKNPLADDPSEVGRAARASARSLPIMRSAAAAEGISLLKSGCVAAKFGKQGTPHATTFTLSLDERTLSWAARGVVSGLLPRSRAVDLRHVSRLLVGRESAVFERYRGRLSAPGRDYLSLSLRFHEGGSGASASSSPPAQYKVRGGMGPAGGGVEPGSRRESLDVSFDDEVTFGLWVAALRALLPPAALCTDRDSAAHSAVHSAAPAPTPIFGEGRPGGVPPPPPPPPQQPQPSPQPQEGRVVDDPWSAQPAGTASAFGLGTADDFWGSTASGAGGGAGGGGADGHAAPAPTPSPPPDLLGASLDDLFGGGAAASAAPVLSQPTPPSTALPTPSSGDPWAAFGAAPSLASGAANPFDTCGDPWSACAVPASPSVPPPSAAGGDDLLDPFGRLDVGQAAGATNPFQL